MSGQNPPGRKAAGLAGGFQAVDCTAMVRKPTRQRRWGDAMWALASAAKAPAQDRSCSD